MKGRGTEIAVFFVLLLAAAVAVLVPGLYSSGPRFLNEKNAFRSLEEYAGAQNVFRAEGKGYWRGDVAGLYALKGADGKPVKLIELSTATADGRPISDISPYAIRSAKAGYWYRTLRIPGDTSPNPEQFAVCAYPDSPTAGKWIYLISHRNVFYRKRFGGAVPPDLHPEDPEKDGWEKRNVTDKY